VRLEDEGHGGFDDGNSKIMLSAMGAILWQHLGKGFNVDDPPVKYVLKK
jgi:hypothetical protein